MNKRVVVTGMGIMTAHGTGKEINWEKTIRGHSSIGEITSFDATGYRGRYGGEVKDFNDTTVYNLRAARLDRASHLLIHTVREALTDAGALDEIIGTDVLLSLGTTLGGMLSGEAFHREVIKRGIHKARLSSVLDYLAHYQAVNIFREFRLGGDYTIFSDACASGTNAIGHAFNSIRNGNFGMAICGGYDTMSEFTFAGFNSLMAITPSLCRPFDRDRDGLVLGEGAGILVLEEVGHAIRRGSEIFCEVAGYGASSDAYHMTSPEPSGKYAAAAIRAALKDSGYPRIDYINAHGTATRHNDVMEARAIHLALGDGAGEIPVSSIKSMIGHLLGGAGAVEAIISILAIIHNSTPPNINFRTPDPECDLLIVSEPEGHNIRTVLSNSFGFGGSNASLILREHQ